VGGDEGDPSEDRPSLKARTVRCIARKRYEVALRKGDIHDPTKKGAWFKTAEANIWEYEDDDLDSLMANNPVCDDPTKLAELYEGSSGKMAAPPEHTPGSEHVFDFSEGRERPFRKGIVPLREWVDTGELWTEEDYDNDAMISNPYRDPEGWLRHGCGGNASNEYVIVMTIWGRLQDGDYAGPEFETFRKYFEELQRQEDENMTIALRSLREQEGAAAC